jgi:hypothetical protein
LPKAEVEAVEAVVFVGLQGAGKSTFYDKLHHVRIGETCGFVVEGWRDEDR